MAATEARRALAALTSAALSLPGLQVRAATPSAAPELGVQAAYYAESGQRMEVETTRTDLVLPFRDRFEFSFSLDQDTYSGATPAFSLPDAMADRPKYKQRSDGSPAAESSLVDVVSAASRGVTAGGLTILGGLNTYKDFIDARGPAQAAFVRKNPRPASPPPPPTLPGPVTLDFDAMAFSAFFGAANVTPSSGGACPGNGAAGCHLEDGMAVGIVADASNPVAHLHRAGPASNRELAYHADSTGIFVRAQNGSAFDLNALKFSAPISASNPDAGANDLWDIVGFNSATLPKLDLGDGRNYPQRVALTSVKNGFDGKLSLDSSFNNIKSFWIHYRGYPRTPTDGKDFRVTIDDIQLGAVQPSTAPTAAQLAWVQRLEREVSIEQFKAVLNRPMHPAGRPRQRLQAQPRESRLQPQFGLRWFTDAGTLVVSAGWSDEPDFKSTFGSLDYALELNDKLTTLNFGYGYTHNEISRSEGGTHGDAATHSHGADTAIYPTLDAQSDYQSVSAGVSHILGKYQVLDLSASYSRQQGYLSNPYKLVYVRGEITPEEYYGLWQAGDDAVDWKAITALEVVGIELFRERRPEERHLGAVSLGFRQRLPALAASLHLDYRYYADDWGIDAHTVSVSWYQSLPREWTLTPFIRYYTQGPADFFAPWFPAPRADGHYSSDYRLSGFGSLSGGLTLGKALGDRLRVQAGIEYYTHQAGLRPVKDGLGDYADYDSLLAHASLSIDLSAAGASPMNGHHDQAHVMPVLPAGVQFADNLRQAGAVTVGYRYLDQRQGGALEHDGNAYAPSALPKGSCLTPRCAAYPSDMGMQMHMLELMYAATDRLTLMLMPQLTSTAMQLKAVADGTSLVEHGSDGVGDTVLGASYRLGSSPRQQWVLGLGLSAPTGENAATPLGDEASLPLDYGMQPGSGTWDARPALTWLRHAAPWHWGAQINGTVRLSDRNDAGYALGNGWQASAWLGRQVADVLQLTVRGIHTTQDAVHGGFRGPHETSATVDNPANHGGDFLDVGFGVTLAFAGGALAGHHAAIEWVQPVSTAFNGVQLAREGALNASWMFEF